MEIETEITDMFNEFSDIGKVSVKIHSRKAPKIVGKTGLIVDKSFRNKKNEQVQVYPIR